MKTIAFYLPQFHPIPENNLWWGAGFTEWHNVSAARPMFRGHRQPQVPGALGYYDLRCDETRHEQAELAKSSGIDAFCYYHYWFGGKQLLETPLNKMLDDKGCDMPFCLCWANETWSRAWDGKESEVLIQQAYSEEDDRKHAEYLVQIFKDSRYLKSEGKPVFIIYRVGKMDDPARFVQILDEAARSEGFTGVRVFAVRNFACDVDDNTLHSYGIEDIVDFQPNNTEYPRRSLFGKGVRFLQRCWNSLARKAGLPQVNSVLRLKYNDVSRNALALYGTLGQNHYPTVFPNWDNSPRRKAATVIQNDNPEDFARWVSEAASIVRKRPERNQFLFVNAWNEWAESAHLEPERKYGDAFLKAFKEGISK
jgi:lipopolysaccharide biosynthesis protein